MKRIGLIHLKAIKKFGSNVKGCKVKDYEIFLTSFVSLPTARKIIADLIDLKIVKVSNSKNDKRVKMLTVVDNNYEKYI